jgi:hypothetical protein
MRELNLEDVSDYVAQHIASFHQNRIEKLRQLNLYAVLERKNPYLFRAKNVMIPADFIRLILDAYLSSQEETLFGDFLEGVALFVANTLYDGYKPAELEGIDLLFERDNRIYIVEIKSGPHWGNSSQIKKMIQNFEVARNKLSPHYPDREIVAVNGCCYGRERQSRKKNGAYWKLCGQDFWRFLSDNDRLYLDIIEPLGSQAQQRNQEFAEAYAALVNELTVKFTAEFCTPSYLIDWEKLLRWVSERHENSSYPSFE